MFRRKGEVEFHLKHWSTEPPPGWEDDVEEILRKELGFTLGKNSFELRRIKRRRKKS